MSLLVESYKPLISSMIEEALAHLHKWILRIYFTPIEKKLITLEHLVSRESSTNSPIISLMWIANG
jgi:hypothetical protein